MADETVSQAAPRRGRINRALVDATTEADIARFNAEDGFDPDDTMAGLAEVLSPAEIRRRVGLTQVQIAERIAVPLRTLRNWEQGRGSIEPAARSLLSLICLRSIQRTSSAS